MTYLFDLLPIGRESAITARELKVLAGAKSTREITLEVERLRKSGIAVCASCDTARPGFYIAESASELSDYLRSLDRRLRSVSQTRRRLGDTLAEMSGQLTFRGGI